MQAVADILNEAYRGTKIGERITKGTPGEGYVGYDKETGKVKEIGPLPGARTVSGAKAAREMGLKYISLQQTIVDTAKVFEALL